MVGKFTEMDLGCKRVQPHEFEAFDYGSVEISKKQEYGTLNAASGGAGNIVQALMLLRSIKHHLVLRCNFQKIRCVWDG